MSTQHPYRGEQALFALVPNALLAKRPLRLSSLVFAMVEASRDYGYGITVPRRPFLWTLH